MRNCNEYLPQCAGLRAQNPHRFPCRRRTSHWPPSERSPGFKVSVPGLRSRSERRSGSVTQRSVCRAQHKATHLPFGRLRRRPLCWRELQKFALLSRPRIQRVVSSHFAERVRMALALELPPTACRCRRRCEFLRRYSCCRCMPPPYSNGDGRAWFRCCRGWVSRDCGVNMGRRCGRGRGGSGWRRAPMGLDLLCVRELDRHLDVC